ncbi:Protein-tyrosine phosphatase-like protein [Amanita muscaria]
MIPVHTLVQLASQYHNSDYNRLKFGSNGSPTHYKPLSLYLPDHFRQLQLRQFRSQHVQVWWLCRRQCPPSIVVPTFGPAGPDGDDLQSEILLAMAEPIQISLPVKTSVSHPLHISSIIPPDLISFISSQLQLSPAPTVFNIPLPFCLDRLLSSHPHLYPHTFSKHISQSCQSDAFVNEDKASYGAGLNFMLGNLFLSSCPGKKVRLDGPSNGRSAVCRDIDSDLKRIKEFGIGCIICCLDDEELTFLGIPWSTYENSARDMGLDISRMPTPEGLAPLDPASLDAVLMDTIKNYTLRSIPVLVHCRGGVGRAGVIACCWLIKLGLCGWLQGQVDNIDNGQANILLEAETLRYVHRVIGVVRTRRSAKAVETYEQVKFLVDYIEYLRQSEPW